MLRRFGAAVAALALLYGFSAAPFTHAHRVIDPVSDEGHPHGTTLVHTHASSHTHHDGDDTRPGAPGQEHGERTWSVESFVFQPVAHADAPVPVLCEFGELHIQLTDNSQGIPLPQPKAHGPPVGQPSGLRAPPAFLPLYV